MSLPCSGQMPDRQDGCGADLPATLEAAGARCAGAVLCLCEQDGRALLLTLVRPSLSYDEDIRTAGGPGQGLAGGAAWSPGNPRCRPLELCRGVTASRPEPAQAASPSTTKSLCEVRFRTSTWKAQQGQRRAAAAFSHRGGHAAPAREQGRQTAERSG